MPRASKTNIDSTPTMTPSTAPSGTSYELPAIVLLSALLFAALSVAGYFYLKAKEAPKIVENRSEIQELKAEIGATYQLPEGEEPTMATVTDKEKLLDQPFFQKAENGDKVLIYSISGRAILYRPSVKKIIEVTTVNVAPPAEATVKTQPVTDTAVLPVTSSPVETEEASKPTEVRIVLLNGSTTTGVTVKVEDQLKAVVTNGVVVAREKAARDSYGKSVIVDITGKDGAATAAIATALKGTVGALPDGEIAPSNTDILVIVGNDR